MRYKIFLTIILTLCCGITRAFGEPEFKLRTWTAKSGATKEATLLRQDSFSVTLKGKDGTQFRVSPSELSEEDQDYLVRVKQFRKYADNQQSTEILESASPLSRGLTFECSPTGILSIRARGYHPNAGAGDVTENIFDPEDFIEKLTKGLEWSRVVREDNVEVEERVIYSSMTSRLQCPHGIRITLRTRDTGSLRSTFRPEIQVVIYNEVFPYSRSALITLSEDDLKTIVTALRRVPFSLLQEHAKRKAQEQDDLFE